MLIARGFFSTINVWLLSIPRVHEGDFFVFFCITKHFNELKCVSANCKLHKSPFFSSLYPLCKCLVPLTATRAEAQETNQEPAGDLK